MRLLKWIFQPAIVLIIAFIIVIYLNRGALFSQPSHSGNVAAVASKVDTLIASMQAPQPASEGQKTTPNSDTMTTDTASAPPVPENKEEIKPDSAPELTPDTEDETPSNENSDGPVMQSMPAPDEVMQVAPAYETDDGSSEANDEEVTPDKQSQRDGTDNGQTTQAAPNSLPTDTGEEETGTGGREVNQQGKSPTVTQQQLMRTWQQARTAAWYGDFKTSIEYYNTLITVQPDNYDAYGEMGNVMLRAGDRDGAVDAYYQAALLLNKLHHRGKAWYLLNIINGLSPEKAHQLYLEMTQGEPKR